MAKIKVKDGKLFLNDKETNTPDARELSGEELGEVTGGREFFSQITLEHIVCENCGSYTAWLPKKIYPSGVWNLRCENCEAEITVRLR